MQTQSGLNSVLEDRKAGHEKCLIMVGVRANYGCTLFGQKGFTGRPLRWKICAYHTNNYIH